MVSTFFQLNPTATQHAWNLAHVCGKHILPARPSCTNLAEHTTGGRGGGQEVSSYPKCLNSNGTGVTKNLFQCQTNYMVSSSQ